MVEGGDVICDTGGSVTDLEYSVQPLGPQQSENWQLMVVKEFGCPDGTFIVLIKRRFTSTSPLTAEVFTWTIVDGTGAYSDLRGQGSGSTVFPADGEFLNTYTGQLHD